MLCKQEQMSNWENRPLRYSQEHYAAMDAWILPELIFWMQEKMEQDKIKVDINKFIKSTSTNKQSEKKVSKKQKRGAKETEAKTEEAKTEEGSKKVDKKKDKKERRRAKAEGQEALDTSVPLEEQLKEAESKIEYHKKMVEHFEEARAQIEAQIAKEKQA